MNLLADSIFGRRWRRFHRESGIPQKQKTERVQRTTSFLQGELDEDQQAAGKIDANRLTVGCGGLTCRPTLSDPTNTCAHGGIGDEASYCLAGRTKEGGESEQGLTGR